MTKRRREYSEKKTQHLQIYVHRMSILNLSQINIHHVIVYSMRLRLEERCIRASNNVNKL